MEKTRILMIKTANNVDNFHIRQVEVREDIVAIQDVVIINIKEVVVEVAGNHLSTMQFLCNSAFMVLEHKLFSHLGNVDSRLIDTFYL